MAGREDYYEHQQERIEHYQDLADKAQHDASAYYQNYRQMADYMPFGQPIVNDATRRGYDKINAAMDHSVNASNKSEYYRNKAETAASNTAISSDAPDAAERLADKAAELEKQLEDMKAANKYYRKNHSMAGFPNFTAEQNAKIDENMKSDIYYHQPQPFPSYHLTNLRAKMKAAQARIQHLETVESMEESEEEINGATLVVNKDANRVQIIFDSIPSEEMRSDLKNHGFHWSPSEGAWQRLLNKYAYQTAKEILTASK